MGLREKPPKKGEVITATWCHAVSDAAGSPTRMRGFTRQVDDTGGAPRPLQPFLALVIETFTADASGGTMTGYGSARPLFLQIDGEYDKPVGELFECWSHHGFPLVGDRIWVTFNQQSGRFEVLAWSPGQIIRFQFTDFSNESDLEANAVVLAADDGRLLGETVQVIDASSEGCYFGDETEAELSDRTGYAAWMQIEEGSGRTARLEVFSLCCPPEAS